MLRLPRLIIDRHLRLGDFSKTEVQYDVSVHKEEVAREHLFARQGGGRPFLDVGGRDGRLDYLLGNAGNFSTEPGMYERNRALFDERFVYHGMDLEPDDEPAAERPLLVGDVCSAALLESHPEFAGYFDVVYSNNVFEHLRRPWIACQNIAGLLRPGGICITITQFAIRYHRSPSDYFRYTHEGLEALFEDAGLTTVRSGYDITGRRNDWQGTGHAEDTCPTDRFGAWRENWFVLHIGTRAE